MKSKLIGVALAIGLALAQSALAADDRESFFQSAESMSPQFAANLRALGADYAAKCKAEPTVAQYRSLASQSEAFSFRMAMGTLSGENDAKKWPAEGQTRYKELVSRLDCLR